MPNWVKAIFVLAMISMSDWSDAGLEVMDIGGQIIAAILLAPVLLVMFVILSVVGLPLVAYRWLKGYFAQPKD